MDAAERELFEQAVRRATETSRGGGGGDALDAALSELGWRDALVTDRAAAVGMLFEAQGRSNATSSALIQVVAAALELPDPDAAAPVLPALRGVAPPGTVDAGRVVVRGLAMSASSPRDTAIVVASRRGGIDAFSVAASTLARRPVHGIDETLGLFEVSGEIPLAETEPLGTAEWDTAVSMAQLALGHELVGTAGAMLDLARQHATERVQFGRPIASFQAVRHRLAEALVALEAAASLMTAAWDEPTPGTAALAKGMAGRSARTVARHSQQVLAGIGFTREHPLHRYVRRTVVLDQLFGAGTLLTARTGAAVVATGRLPSRFPL